MFHMFRSPPGYEIRSRCNTNGSIRRLQDKHQTTLITIEYLDAIYNLDASYSTPEDPAEDVQFLDDDSSIIARTFQ